MSSSLFACSSGQAQGLSLNGMAHDTDSEAARVRLKVLAGRTSSERLSEALAASDVVRSLERLECAQRSSRSRADGAGPMKLKDR